ncbi:Homoserine/homoserine lactone efflux protein [Saliniradius amylolyticus]|uniref:Homoserine/homoserine lactone efflux protein n=1 Tax=Saliniradius amylolyticus TaxID=2183582 RepID=A0A2S2E092_9ALTE|nr:LysE family translocator [Saliniradius amylolyticus]AWL11033.1 Homoserine/homoserine lactone efflux protein [Saliniradius amylolyticus]
MVSMDVLLTFSLACVVLSLSPGPSNLYIMARSLSQGFTSGAAAAGGLAIGSLLYVLASVLGLAAIFKYSPTAYLAIKLVGAAYLIYLGLSYFRNATTVSEPPRVGRRGALQVVRQSLIVELTNPKTALFFLAFLPQFVRPESGSVSTQLALLGLTYTLIALASDIFVAAMSARLGRWLAGHPSFQYWQDRISGTILTLLGSYIAVDELVLGDTVSDI